MTALFVFVLLLFAVGTSGSGAVAASGDDWNNPEEVAQEHEQLGAEEKAWEEMLEQDDSKSPIDYGYGPGVLPPGWTKAGPPRRDAGAKSAGR